MTSKARSLRAARPQIQTPNICVSEMCGTVWSICQIAVDCYFGFPYLVNICHTQLYEVVRANKDFINPTCSMTPKAIIPI